jgi:hypothetical protein
MLTPRTGEAQRSPIVAGPRGGGCKIRTREGLPPTRFPTMLTGVHLRSPPSVTCPDACGPTPCERCRTSVSETPGLGLIRDDLAGEDVVALECQFPRLAARLTASPAPSIPRPAGTSDMARVSIAGHPLTATAALVWNGDLPRPLQQILFDTADGVTPPSAPPPLAAARPGQRYAAELISAGLPPARQLELAQPGCIPPLPRGRIAVTGSSPGSVPGPGLWHHRRSEGNWRRS